MIAPAARNTKLRHAGPRPPMTISTLLELPNPSTLDRADNPIRSTRERPATLNTGTLGTRMLHPVTGPPLSVVPLLRLRMLSPPLTRPLELALLAP